MNTRQLTSARFLKKLREQNEQDGLERYWQVVQCKINDNARAVHKLKTMNKHLTYEISAIDRKVANQKSANTDDCQYH